MPVQLPNCRPLGSNPFTSGVDLRLPADTMRTPGTAALRGPGTVLKEIPPKRLVKRVFFG